MYIGISGVNDLKTVIGSMPELKKVRIDFLENYIGE